MTPSDAALSSNQYLYNKLPYNLDKDLTPVTVFPSGPLVVGIHDKIPAKTISRRPLGGK